MPKKTCLIKILNGRVRFKEEVSYLAAQNHPMKKLYFPFLALLVVLSACTGKRTVTGLQVFKDYDSTRLFDMNRAQGHRPVKVDVYYPADATEKQNALLYGDILDMYEQRMDYSVSLDSCRAVSRMLADAFANYLHLDTADKILQYKTDIYSDLPLPTGKHPLIVYASSMNGSSWENAILFDSLTHQGYVVAAVSSVGLFPGVMTSAEDVDEQVDDVLYAVHKMKTFPFIDTAHVGLLGWSLGSTSTTKAAMLENFQCLASFDGTEIHYYGIDSAWDQVYDAVMQIPPFAPAKLTLPYLYLASERAETGPVINLQKEAASKDKYYLQMKGATHEDFCTITGIINELSHRPENKYVQVCQLTTTFFNQYLKPESGANIGTTIQQLVSKNPDKYSTTQPGK
jgi:dienelactone hydrolase